ncbi:hypothetical protein V8C40DRAFT_276097 [Trichoderma camerunense]
MATNFYDAHPSSWVGICMALLLWLGRFAFPMAFSHPADNGGSSWTKAASTSSDMQRQGSMFSKFTSASKSKENGAQCSVNAIVVPFPRWQLGARNPPNRADIQPASHSGLSPCGRTSSLSVTVAVAVAVA